MEKTIKIKHHNKVTKQMTLSQELALMEETRRQVNDPDSNVICLAKERYNRRRK